jgi:hypothetical protein
MARLAPTVLNNAETTVGLELRALGPVEAVVGGVLVNLGPPKQRALFAMFGETAQRRDGIAIGLCVQSAADIGAAPLTPYPRRGVADSRAGICAG